MKNSFKNIMVATFVLLSITVNAQIKNSKTEIVKIYGNCGMCETKIEKAGTIKKVATVDWNQETQMATLTYDATKTNQDEILKRIALAGYDSDKFLAPYDVYDNLHGCCQYERVAKVAVTEEIKSETTNKNHSGHDTTSKEAQDKNQLETIFDNYFLVKNALVKSDGNSASTNATKLLSEINAVKMENLKADVHVVWMKVVKNLKEETKLISETKDIKVQRDYFDTLSVKMYELIKISKPETPIYYQNCPMANDGKGANWLSKENAVKNPYYGSMMLTCGKTIETIK
ncbi:DUF3347 domain-containing protein [Flavobacterium sp. F372]|uniref:DUF3347 domain-containing protein n=1 Tax=Flavobacterium bernardetii TaxID=2813823 RepID=A0ABR7IX62_9FLAO|nr:DUF3347 domain-containing protein [Flavobacterium bernardetii]MBC5834358.1 DUF3347 domain-containing protein [Flavobacterium bernardetii]NHF70003.1 DUF3347 domain-containing protein [Flavobacterium bernardetii]